MWVSASHVVDEGPFRAGFRLESSLFRIPPSSPRVHSALNLGRARSANLAHVDSWTNHGSERRTPPSDFALPQLSKRVDSTLHPVWTPRCQVCGAVAGRDARIRGGVPVRRFRPDSLDAPIWTQPWHQNRSLHCQAQDAACTCLRDSGSGWG